MIDSKTTIARNLLTALALVATASVASSKTERRLKTSRPVQTTMVAYPWSFQSGNKLAVQTALDSISELLGKTGNKSVTRDAARAAWKIGNFGVKSFGKTPTNAALIAFGKSVSADEVVYGNVAWATTKLYSGATPIVNSVATVDIYILDVTTGKLMFKNEAVKGRSDESASDLYTTPLVLATTNGKRTADQQRAGQIAVGRALEPWVKLHTPKA